MVSTERGWWRRSRAALLALVVLVPASIAAALSIDAFEYLADRPRVITTVERGATGAVGDASIRVIDSLVAVAGTAAGDRYEVPAGTALVAVTLELDAVGAHEEFRCQVRMRDTAVDRRWTSGFPDADYSPGRGLPDDVPSACAWADRAFPFEVAFTIPAEAVDDVVLEVFTSDQLPQAVHLRLS
jgi:hypothetical protein